MIEGLHGTIANALVLFERLVVAVEEYVALVKKKDARDEIRFRAGE